MASSRETPSDVVTLKAMRFHARIGVLPHDGGDRPVDRSRRVALGSQKRHAVDRKGHRRLPARLRPRRRVVTHGHISFLERLGTNRGARTAVAARRAREDCPYATQRGASRAPPSHTQRWRSSGNVREGCRLHSASAPTSASVSIFWLKRDARSRPWLERGCWVKPTLKRPLRSDP